MLRAYKYRLYPNKEQAELINKNIGCARFIFNLALETKNYAYASHRKNLSCFELMRQTTDLKKECEWLKEVDSQALQQAITDLDRAFTSFFKGKTKFPNFKKKRGNQGFRNPHGNKVEIKNSKLFQSKFKEGISITVDRELKGQIRSTTISKTPTNKYFASVLVDTNIAIPEKPPITEQRTLGIDLGIKDFAIMSNGEKVANPKYLRNALQRLKVLQRRASKKVKGSNNRKKANLKVAIQHERITNKRDDFLHKLSYKLTHDNQVDTICVESLNVSGMIKNHKLAQAVSDVGWSKFVSMLKYKSEWYGKNFIQIGRFEPSTKTCSKCGTKSETLTLANREWLCTNCGTLHDRDINAAINIKLMGLKQSGMRSPDVPVELPTMVGAGKQEIDVLINQ